MAKRNEEFRASVERALEHHVTTGAVCSWRRQTADHDGPANDGRYVIELRGGHAVCSWSLGEAQAMAYAMAAAFRAAELAAVSA